MKNLGKALLFQICNKSAGIKTLGDFQNTYRGVGLISKLKLPGVFCLAFLVVEINLGKRHGWEGSPCEATGYGWEGQEACPSQLFSSVCMRTKAAPVASVGCVIFFFYFFFTKGKKNSRDGTLQFLNSTVWTVVLCHESLIWVYAFSYYQ